MTPPVSCADLDDLAAELALGILPGDERAGALAHLSECPRCRRVVDELAEAVEAVTAAAPPVPLPAGFVRRATGGLGSGRRRRWSARWAVVVTAVASLVLAAVIASHEPRPPSLAQALPPSALTAPGVRTAALVSAGPEHFGGVAFVRPSTPSWLFVTVTDDDTSRYVCEVQYADGHAVRLGSFTTRHGAGAWYGALAGGGAPPSAVNLRTADGAIVATATFG